MGASQAHQGRQSHRIPVANRVLELEPNFRVGSFEYLIDGFMLPELGRPILAGMRQAGLPE